MPKHFSKAAFEHILFPMHVDVYAAIEAGLDRLENTTPGFLQNAEALCRISQAKSSQEELAPADLAGLTLPAEDLHLDVSLVAGTKLRLQTDAQLRNVPHEAYGRNRYPGCHLIVTLHGEPHRRAFIVPLGYVLRSMEDITRRAAGHQIYQHRLYPQAAPQLGPVSSGAQGPAPLDFFRDTGFVYTGLTSRNWAVRFREHRRAAGSGSHLLFHQALRGDLFAIQASEHEVLRVGLTQDEAMMLEEKEVEDTSLYPIKPNGLNMIPGGHAGLQFTRNFGGVKADGVAPERMEDTYSDCIEFLLKEGGTGGSSDGSALSDLWRSNLDYRTRVMTGNEKRLSPLQIMTARILEASGWLQSKIVTHVDGLEGRRANEGQIKQLLAGKTYRSLPNGFLNSRKGGGKSG